VSGKLDNQAPEEIPGLFFFRNWRGTALQFFVCFLVFQQSGILRRSGEIPEITTLSPLYAGVYQVIIKP
jgi:hypothetical protein